MESPQDFLAHRHAPGRRLSRRSLLGWSAAGALAAAAGLFTARAAYHENASGGRVLFEDDFAGNSLSREHWNPYICDVVHTFARRNKRTSRSASRPPSRPPIVSQVRTSPLGLSAGVVANDLCGRDYFRARVTIEKEATCAVYSNVGV